MQGGRHLFEGAGLLLGETATRESSMRIQQNIGLKALENFLIIFHVQSE